ncbi:hypothetical protein GE09DRAFT_1087770 [Coniochaeta sp. 2T2.1]|nr:hypothetical protein GE09DRAFT_1087770 [Coniochaeta sp. 2T2.1]
MPSASSPIAYPSSPSSPRAKRPYDQDTSPKPKPKPESNPKTNGGPIPKAKPRVTAGFLDDDSDDDENMTDSLPALPKLPDLPKPKPRTTAGFLDDSDDDDVTDKPPLKRRALDDAFSKDSVPPPSTNPGGPLEYELPSLQDDGITTPPDSQPAARSQLDIEHFLGVAKGSLFANLPASRPFSKTSYQIVTCSGKSASVPMRKTTTNVSYQSMVADRSKTKEGRAKRSYYGIDIHELVTGANKELAAAKQATPITPPANPDQPVRSVEEHGHRKKSKKCLLWTEKYRARNFADLVGDDLTNRQVLRWLKRWDPVVFPHVSKKTPVVRRPVKEGQPAEEKPLRKILMLTGPPGLGKTTLAHVCARQAGYEVLEINASDDRSSAVVKGRIRTSLGTESVKTVEHNKPEAGKQAKVARPVCVVVDEVDGVVTGSGAGGEGGFVRALIDLVMTDQKNSTGVTSHKRNKKKGDDFRQMRPLILICNDVYAPSLRPLRQSGLAEVIHCGKPSMDAVVSRLKSVFEKEGIPCDKDAARKLCEAAWGMTSGIDAKRGAEGNVEGDLRGIMVVGEMVASRLRAASTGTPHLTRQWVEKNIMSSLAHGGGGARGLGRGGSKEIVGRVFQEGAGFPKQTLAPSSSKNTRHEQPQTELSFAEQQKKYGALRLAEMVETCGEIDRIVTDVFLEYPNREYNDDSFLTKPDTAYEWLHFHDTCSTRLFAGQEWELGPYLSQPVLACHNLFASVKRHMPAQQDRQWGDTEENPAPPVPFSGPRADFEAREAEKVNRAMLQGIQAALPPSLHRAFRSPEHVASDFLPYLVRLVSPDVKPVVIGGGGDKWPVASVRRDSERTMVKRAANVLAEVGIQLIKGKIEAEGGGLVGRPTWVYRMEPDLDTLSTYETAGAYALGMQAPTRYAVRQVLDQELQKSLAQREHALRQARFQSGSAAGVHEAYIFNDDKENNTPGMKKANVSGAKEFNATGTGREGDDVKRDFFGRVIVPPVRPLGETDGNAEARREREERKADTNVWVTFHEGLNNAVRKPLSLQELLRGL